MSRDQLHRNSSIEEAYNSSQEHLPFLEKRHPPRHRYLAVWPWIISNISLGTILLGLIVYQTVQLDKHCASASSPAFRTDLKDSHPYIVLEERDFTGKLWYDKDTERIYREVDSSKPQYFGPPNPDIDGAWDDLLRGEFVRMTPEEAAPYTPDLTQDPRSDHYHFEPDMFHSLHCLNAVRKELDKDYYSQLGPDHTEMMIQNSTAFPSDWGRMHMDHCLDQLRQAIQCQGDLSPVPLYHHPGVSVGLGVGQTHTCRKWEPMRHWMDERKKRQLKDANS